MFERFASRRALELDDTRLAAAHFNWLVMSIPLNQAMLLGDDEPATPAELEHYADAGVSAFLAAYRKQHALAGTFGLATTRLERRDVTVNDHYIADRNAGRRTRHTQIRRDTSSAVSSAWLKVP